MSRKLQVLALLLALASPAVFAQVASRVFGQPDFLGFIPNRLDGRGMVEPWGVAVDASRTPNGIWVVDAGNNRVLGWRDITSLRNGMRADVVIGQPDARSNLCNNGGMSAASLCFAETYRHDSYEPGVAVDGEGNLYVSDQFNRRVLGYHRPFDTDRVADIVLGQDGFGPAGETPGTAVRLVRPHGLAADAQGNLYVGDEIRVLEYDRPFATDTRPDRVFGQPNLATLEIPADPAAPDSMRYAAGVAVDAQGRLYVAEGWMDRVMVWEEPLARQGAADLLFSQGVRVCDYGGCNTKGIAVEPDGDVWVGSRDQGRVFGYRTPAEGDTDPDRILAALNAGREDEPEAPTDGQPMFAGGGLAVDSAGTLWLADKNRVLGFLDPWEGDDRADRLLGQARPDQIEANLVDLDGLETPDGIALDRSSNPPHLYVVDAGNNRVLGWADAESFAKGRRADLVIGQPDSWASGCNTGGRSLASLCLGYQYNGIAVDGQGMLWVSDAGNARVLGYRAPFASASDTVADRVLGGIGCAAGARGLCLPGGLAVDKSGNLYVADIRNNRIVEFNQPARRDALADRVLGECKPHQTVCNPATYFSEENSTHPGLIVSGGALAIDAAGRLLVGNGSAVYVFARPLAASARSRKLVDLSFLSNQYQPRDLAIDAAGDIYLSTDAHVYRFSSSGAGPSLVLGEACADGYSTGLPEGLGPASLCTPAGLETGPGNELFVSDAETNRVVVFEDL